MGSELFFENKKYIPVRDASALTGYSKDYIGQLCRANKIDARRIGKIWYVSEVSILSYEPAAKENIVAENVAPIIAENISSNSKKEISNLQSKYSVSRIGEIFASRRNKDISDGKNSNVSSVSTEEVSSPVKSSTNFSLHSSFRPASVLIAAVFIFGLISIGGQLKNVSPKKINICSC
jgi:hypothetical protein